MKNNSYTFLIEIGTDTDKFLMPYLEKRIACAFDPSVGLAFGVFALADTAFAHACNSDNVVTVAQQCQINFLQPGRVGDVLIATAKGRTHSGRTGLYDVTITGNNGAVIAEFRGMSRKLRDPVIPDAG